VIRLTPADPGYPGRLRTMKGRPDPLWLWGEMPQANVPTVGVVGTRRVTSLGTRIARIVAMTLARAGAVIVSGLAQGIDSAAHAAALEAGGRTIAVLGEGLAFFDEHGPIRRRQLARRIRVQGALISEYPLDLRGTNWTFPQRNKMIAALSDVLVVVEAPRDSGALITADESFHLHRPVFVVPGPMDAPTWLGSNDYIAKGKARILASVQQVAEHLRLTIGEAAPEDPAARDRLASVLAAEPADADTIAAALGIRPADAATLIAEELIAGHIVATGDGRFARR
jgi:DNA processing protein